MISASIAIPVSSAPAVPAKILATTTGVKGQNPFQSLLLGVVLGEEEPSPAGIPSLIPAKGKQTLTSRREALTAPQQEPASAIATISRDSSPVAASAIPVFAAKSSAGSPATAATPVETATSVPADQDPVSVSTPATTMISRVLDLAVQWTPQAAISQSGAAPSISGNLSKKTKLVAAKDAPKASQPKAAASTVPADVAAAAPIVLPLVLNLQLPAQVAASSGPAARVRPQTTGAASGEGTPDVPDTTHDASKTEAADFVAPAPLPTIAFQARVNQASVSQPTDVVSLSETPAPSVKAAASAATSSGINVKVPDEPDQPAPAATPATAPLQAKTTTASAKESASADATIPPASNDSAPFNGVPPVHFAVAAAGDHSSTHTTPDSAQSAEPAPEPRDAAQYESAQASSVSPSGTSPSSVQPLREVTLHVTSDSQKVDVQLSDRRGELQVVVKSGDPGLTNDLRSGLDELVGGLEKSGFRAEAWRPDDTPRHNFQPVAGASRGSGTGEQSDQQPGQDPREQGRNSYAAEYVPRRKSRGGNADWTNQISSLMGAEKEN